MTTRSHIVSAAVFLLLFASFSQGAGSTSADCGLQYVGTVLLVRHAEKAKTPADDPTLTPEGKARAKTLAHVCRQAGVQTIYATSYQRTQLTAKPLAAALGLDVNVKKNAKTLLADIKKKPDGQVILVVGHSNTLPEIIKKLGGERVPDLIGYGKLYVLTRMTCSCTDVTHSKVITLKLGFGVPSR